MQHSSTTPMDRPSRQNDLTRAMVVAAVMVAACVLAIVMTPRRYLADQYPREKLQSILPAAFGEWEIDRSIVPVPPSPDVQEVVDATYDETVALTYRNHDGQRVMLSIAYGRNQHKGMNTHRPEVCYPAQGFKLIQDSTPGTLVFGNRNINVTRLVAAMGSRNEPITYWLLVGDRVTHFGYSQRATVITYGLHGVVPDGVLVRVSSIDRDNKAAFQLQTRFVEEMLSAIRPEKLPRLIGAH